MRVRDLKKALDKLDENLIIVARDYEGVNRREVENDNYDLYVGTCDFYTTEQVYVRQKCLLIEP